MDVPARDEATSWVGTEVVGSDGTPVGLCRGVFADADTGVTEWLEVDVPGGGRTVVPALDAALVGEQVRVAFPGDAVLSAPALEPGSTLSTADERRLYTHYGVPYSAEQAESLLPAGLDADTDDRGPDDRGPADGVPDKPVAVVEAPEPDPVAPLPPAVEATTTTEPEPVVPVTPAVAATTPAPVPLRVPDAGPTLSKDQSQTSGAGIGASATPLVGVAALGAAVFVVLGWLDRRARNRRRPRERARRLAEAVRGDVVAAARRGRSSTQSGVEGVGRAGRAVAAPAVGAPHVVAAGGRRVKRSVARTLWDAATAAALGGGYVLGARSATQPDDESAPKPTRRRSAAPL